MKITKVKWNEKSSLACLKFVRGRIAARGAS